MSETSLEAVIEDLSMTFVLEDVTDPECRQQLIDGFEEMADLCRKENAPDMARVCQRLAAFIQEESPLAPAAREVVSQTLTALQTVARGARAMSNAGVPDALGLEEQPGDEGEKGPEAAGRETTEETGGGERDTSRAFGLRHPGNLPDHLDEEDFAGFLFSQDTVLENIESLLFELEAGDTGGLPRLKRLFHTMKGEAGFLRLDDVEKLCHRAEDLIGGDDDATDDYVEVLFQVKDWLTQAFAYYRRKTDTCAPVDEIMQRLDKAAFERAGGDEQSGDEHAAEAVLSEITPQPAKADTGGDKKGGKTGNAHADREYFNVDAERIDQIVNMIGELVVVESMIAQSREATEQASPAFTNLLSQLGKISQGLQRSGLSLRMVPIRSVFMKLRRIVRDLSRKQNKTVQFIITGEDTELDKTIVDKIVDPLMHIVRNSVDHGIEDRPENRTAAGKPEEATIEVRAFHEGGNICIEVADDGLGIDTDAVRKKAEAHGLIDKDEGLAPDAVHNLIFMSGFSTAGTVTDVSGRGVGLDVVSNNLNELKGRVSVRSDPGRGTVFSIRIPVTLAIIDGMIIRVGEKQYIIPALSVLSLMAMEGADISSVYQKGEMVQFDNRFLPVLRLDRLFHINGGDGENPIIVVVENEHNRAGLVVDEVLGKQQVVIKSLGASMQHIPGVSGGAIMGDGRVGLVLDVGGIVALAHGGEDDGAAIMD
ncbi:MAG: chemotaxis protein CheA [Thermodesulfobacteriota bacterium]|nr:chemotaxis protein CheA [Thermodesulfobacteriota bacterium]